MRFQDFKKVNDYHSALFRIISQLKYCGETITDEQIIQKTLSTFHVSQMNIQHQYRNMELKSYSDLIRKLLLAEKNNELLLKNHHARPTGSKAIPEVNALNKYNRRGRGNVHNRGHGHDRGRGGGRGHGHGYNYGNEYNQNRGQPLNRGRGRGRGRIYNQGRYQDSDYKTQPHKKYKDDDHGKHLKVEKDVCYRCGDPEHWSRRCRAPEHLVKLYQESQKRKEVNYNEQPDDINDRDDETHLNTADFAESYDME